MRIVKMLGALSFLACFALAAVPVTASANTGSGYKRMSKMKHHGMMQRHKMMMMKK